MRGSFVNAHTHLYSGLAPFGMPAPAEIPRTFAQILEQIWWRLDRALDEASLRAAARFYVAHAARAGTSILVDHHESPGFIDGSLDVLAEACTEFGARAVLSYGATERNGGRDEARRGLAECRRFILANRRPGVAGVVGLHASFTVSDETIREAGRLCRELGTVLHVHVAEDSADVEDARQRGYAGPLERLFALDALPAGSILAHGVYLTAAQVGAASDAGCWFVQNPRSNRNNRVGYPAAIRSASRVALGTDGFPSDMREEAAALTETAVDHGEQLGAFEGRLDAGWRLASDRLPEAEIASARQGAPPIDDSTLAGIEAEARAQAARLWARW
ncbi:MAG TPA: amidohydrolase family protein [Vicinamibacterales bacterium]|jgi:cytosine/adenosine deaminase-related metal-dependent hydrolase